jgi:hypothetical protein
MSIARNTPKVIVRSAYQENVSVLVQNNDARCDEDKRAMSDDGAQLLDVTHSFAIIRDDKSQCQGLSAQRNNSQFEVSLRAPDAFPGATLAPALQVQVSNLHSRREIASSQKTLLAMTY